MKKILYLIFVLYISLMSSSCGVKVNSAVPRQEVSVYEEKTIDTGLPLQLSINCDYSEIEFYTWDREQVKFEMTRRIRGESDREALRNKLDKFNLNIEKEDNRVTLTGSCKVQSVRYPDSCIEIRVYLPRKVSWIDCKITDGKLKFFDDLKCDLDISARGCSTEVSSLEGRIKYKSETGFLRISSGELRDGSEIDLTNGNVTVFTSFREGGLYSIKTKNGIIKLKVPEEINAIFDYPGADKDSYLSTAAVSSQSRPAHISLKSGINKIEISRSRI